MNPNNLPICLKKGYPLESEEDVLKFWEEHKMFEKSLEINKDGPLYVFYDGPPFATGLPHYGHILASTLKDTVCRYWTQCGYYVPRRFGWDTHGLPIEYEIEKELGIKTKEEIEKMGIGNYNEACRGIVMRYREEWRSRITRLGRWIDFDNDYKTMDPQYMESVWWVFSQLWKKGLVYQGVKVMPYSTACHTPLSNFEAKSNYKEVDDPSIIVKFELLITPELAVLLKLPNDNKSPIYLLVWTTTPWTLLSNLAVCLNPAGTYVCAKRTDEYVILSENAFKLSKESVKKDSSEPDPSVVSIFQGSALLKAKYKPLYDLYTGKYENSFIILGDNYVKCAPSDNPKDSDNKNQNDETETSDAGDGGGTGLVHQAPAFGEDDYRVCSANNIIGRGILPPCPIDDNGNFTNEVGAPYAGLYFKDCDKFVLNDLKKRKLLYSQKTQRHKYPFCWRSDTPLMYRIVTCWFIDVKSLRDRLLANNAQINWVPDFIGKNKFATWLSNSVDWCVSRNRYWGTPLPIWSSAPNSKEGEEIEHYCIGSIEELESLAGLTRGTIVDLHSHHIDQITFKSPKTGRTLTRVAETLDCWFESGSMPYAQCHYPFENKEAFEKNFPCDFIAEGTDQTRGWFYTLLVLSTALFDKPAFKNVIVNGLILAEDGEKMSKRKKNYPEPTLVMDKYGADPLRLYLLDSKVVRADSLRFQEAGLKTIKKNVHIMVDNMLQYRKETIEFFERQTGTHYEPVRVVRWGRTNTNPLGLGVTALKNPLDSWIFHCLENLQIEIHKHMRAYDLSNILSMIEDFVDKLSRWWIKLNKMRLRLPNPPIPNDLIEDARIGLSVLDFSLHGFSLAMAPFAPFQAEIIYQKVSPRLANSLSVYDKMANFVRYEQNANLLPEVQSKKDNSAPPKKEKEEEEKEEEEEPNEVIDKDLALRLQNSPFGLEEVGDADSVHLNPIPEGLEFTRDFKMIMSMDHLIKVLGMVRSMRAARGLNKDGSKEEWANPSIKMPYGKAVIVHPDPQVLDALKNVEEILTSESNILEIEWSTDSQSYISYGLAPNYRVLGPKLGKSGKEFKEHLSSLNSDKEGIMKQIHSMQLGESMVWQGFTIGMTDLVITTELSSDLKGYQISNDGELIVLLDPMISPELEDIYSLKMICRKLQEYRRELGLKLGDAVLITYEEVASSENKNKNKRLIPSFFEKHEDHLGALIGKFVQPSQVAIDQKIHCLGELMFIHDDESLKFTIYSI